MSSAARPHSRRRLVLWPVALAMLAAVAAAVAGPSPRRGGPSVALGLVVRQAGCHARGPLPDPGCTPGAILAHATTSAICRTGYARSVRNVPLATKVAVYRAYGLPRRYNGRNGELDHLVALELGGSNSSANLFPEAADPRPGSREKDRLENVLHDEVCSGSLGLAAAQRLMAGNWVAAFRTRFG